MARDRLAAMRAQQSAGQGGYGGAGNNGYGDHLYPTQQTTGAPYIPPSAAPPSIGTNVQPEPAIPAAASSATPPQTQSATADAYEMYANPPPSVQTAVAPPAASANTAASSAAYYPPAPAPAHVPASKASAGGHYTTAGAAASGKPAGSFFGSITEIQDDIRQIEQNINVIADLHSRSLNNIGEAAQMQAEAQLTEVAQETSTLTNGVKNKIKALEAEAARIPASGPAPEGIDKNVRLTQIGAVKNRFKETILRYQEVEKAYRVKYRQRTERQLRIVKPDATESEVQAALDDEAGGQQIFANALLQSNRQGEARGALREVQERNSDIRRIERTITELAQLFQEMSILVEQQDEQLNVIQDHAMHTEQEVQAGRKQTDNAVRSAQRRRKRRWICFWILVVLILILIAVLVGAICGSLCKSSN
ncbi:hypothetical protein MCUN1_002338 [Malassezia cuniculi]|uniref:Syntaxin-like protein psy1 n=1 Tax=Malassezia cuniculi TaxID=948313 RepID=A0AAF0EZB8_9BASI|nr:hypothetical protein MCUN1_002338 [Malassezia cuniculi]